MKNWRRAVLRDGGTVAEAIRIVDTSGIQFCMVLDENDRLLGTVTDGDIRRALLKAIPLDAKATEIARREPKSARLTDTPERLIEIMRVAVIRQLPIVDDGERVLDLVVLDDMLTPPKGRDNWVVLMAGGLGNRLQPLTADTPKPLLKVGNQPLLETILETFLAHDFRKFYVSVNYMADQIKAHFGDGGKWNCTIRYLEEDQRLGTAGALSLIGAIEKPVVVMNGDVLTTINFASLLDFHDEQGSCATMCVREYDFQVPYGVVELENQRITSIVEKPTHTFFVNAGIYVLDPQVLSLIPQSSYFEMTELFAKVIARKGITAAFPIREYWIDIGKLEDFHRANGEYPQLFK